jgi:PPE-repeat protein
MSIDFGALPPEINSGLMYTGPGSTSLMTASSAWNAVAAELNSFVLQYNAVVTQLAGEEWLGPASALMASAALPYAEWASTTSAAAEQAAAQLQAAAGAFETAFASVVPPPLIAANRAELAQALQTNVFGQNNGVIAQLESQYGEMWAQDSAAMYNYAGQAAAASQVTQFTAAPTVASPAASSTQAAATSAAASTPGASILNTLTTTLQNLITNFNQDLILLQTPAGTQKLVTGITNSSPQWTQAYFLLSGNTALSTNLSAFTSAYSPYASFFYNTEGLPYFSVGMGNFGVQIAKSVGAIGGAAPAAAAAVPHGLPGLGGLLGGAAGAAHPAAALGGAGSVGKLSVPVSWSGAAPPVSHAAVPVSAVSAAPEGTGSGNLLGGMPLGAMGAHGAAGAGPRYGFKPTIMARPPAAG